MKGDHSQNQERQTILRVDACLYSLAYSIVVRRIPSNDSVISCTMESVSPALLNSSDAFPPGYLAYTQRGCCGGQSPNFFTSYPTGLQVTQIQ